MFSDIEKIKEWDVLAIEAGACFLQSSGWGSVQESRGKKVRMAEAGNLRGLVLEQPLPFGFSYYYLPRGPFGPTEDPQALAALAAKLKATARAKTLFLRVEPFVPGTPERSKALRAAGFLATAPVQPKETRTLDLRKDEEALLKEMTHNTRYAIRAAGRRGVTIRKATGGECGKAFVSFWELFALTNDRHELKAFPKAYYEAIVRLDGACSSDIFLAELEGRPIAAAIIVRFGGTATYLYAASKAGFGKYNAPSLLLWEAMRDAKKGGCETFDLWGVSRTKKKWAGVTAFKKSFGGEEVAYVGTWDMPFKKLLYRAYIALGNVVH